MKRQNDPKTLAMPPDTARCSIEQITPELAKRLLRIRSKNIRPPRWQKVVAYSENMKRMEWIFNGASLVLDDKTGGVLDGNHRLLACIRAKTPFFSVVVRGVRAETYSSMDIGSQRGSRDHLQVGTGRKFSLNDAALMTMILGWFTQRYSVFAWRDSRFAPSKADQAIFGDVYYKLGHTINPTPTERFFAGIRTRTATFGFVEWFFQNFSEKDSPVYAEYCDRFFDGVGLSAGHPVLHVRNTLLRGVPGAPYAVAVERMRVFCLGLQLTIRDPYRDYSSNAWSSRLARHRSEFPVFNCFNQMFPYAKARQMHAEYHEFWRQYVHFPQPGAVKDVKKSLGGLLNESFLPDLVEG